MRRSSWGVLLAVAAAVALGAAAGSASAVIFNEEGSGLRVRWTEWQLEVSGGLVVVRCPVTLEGSFAGRTFHKIVGVRIGGITRAGVKETSCTSNTRTASVRFLAESLAWPLRYRSFGGTLPRPTSIGVDAVGPAIRLTDSTFGLNCLYRASEGSAMQGSLMLNAAGEVTTFRNEFSIPLNEGGGFCSGPATGSGSGTVTQLPSAAALTIRLI